jgi:hypothetical protein
MAKPLTLTIDPEEASLDDGEVLFRHTRDGGFLCLGIGAAAQFLRTIDDSNLRRTIETSTSSSGSVGPSESDAYLARLSDEIALANYDPHEPRDEHGRWTSEGAAGAAAATATSAAAGARNIFGNAEILPALRNLAERLLGPRAAGPAAAFFGTLFLPTNQSLRSEGTLPDAPEFSYQFDQGTGVLFINRQHEDGTTEELFRGRPDADGVFRDKDGNPIGQHLGSSVALDADAIRGYEARAKSRDQSEAGAVPRTAAVADTGDPKLCPDPSPDKPGEKKAGAIAYQMYIGMVVNGEPLPQGFGIKMVRPNGQPVYFDDCQRTTGILIDAKGKAYFDLLYNKGAFMRARTLVGILDQAERQTEAAQGRPIDWHFAEKGAADYVRPILAQRYPGITVIFTPPPPGLIGDLERMLKGLEDELGSFRGLLPERRASTLRPGDF